MQKPISGNRAEPIRFVIVTLDSHLSGAVDHARATLVRDYPGLELSLHAASEWGNDPHALADCIAAIETADIVVATMLFMEDHIQAVLPAMKARAASCDAMICCMSEGEIIRLTRMGRFNMGEKQSGIMSLLKKLRGSKKPQASSGANQMAMLRRLPKILRFIPGTAQDARAYFLTLQYWLAGSDENTVNMVRFLISRYAGGPREHLREVVKADAPQDYPETGVYHPSLKERLTDDLAKLKPFQKGKRGTVGVLILRSYVLAGDSAHYDGVIAALEARGLNVITAFAAGLDSRPAIETFFMKDGRPIVDTVISLTGFSLVGGPAYNDAKAAEDILAKLDVPYLAAHALEFQSLEQWGRSERGLMPVESTIMVAIPELDGATGPTVFGGRSSEAAPGATEMNCCSRRCQVEHVRGSDGQMRRAMRGCPERAEQIAARVERLVSLRRSRIAERKVAIVLFNFPPNGGGVGTAMNLSVYASLFNTLKAMKREGYTLDLPESADALREQLLGGNAARFGTDANVAAHVSTDDHVRHTPWLDEIEAQWGPAPGRHLTDGKGLQVMGLTLGNVFIGVQPAFGYEGDPMRLLFEKSFTPTHAFCAFYRYLRDGFGANAVLHFGTHGALEFMPGKQTGLSGDCWPERLIGDLPNFYLYAANNPSEGAIAKRRSGATLVSYLTPPVGQAGLYRGLIDLKASLERWRGLPPEAMAEREDLSELIQAQAAELDLALGAPAWNGSSEGHIAKLAEDVIDLEHALIPHGLHVVGAELSREARIDFMRSIADASHGLEPSDAALELIADGGTAEAALKVSGLDDPQTARMVMESLVSTHAMLLEDTETQGLLDALSGHYMRPAPGGDLIRTPDVLPTGRNLHGFDPFRLPSRFALIDGKAQADRLLARHEADGNALPRSVALVLWGTDNLKSEGGPIGQALSLMGAAPRFDSYGRLCGATLIPLEELGRPRIDVVITLSGIFRDLLPLQTRLLAEAAWLAATADEPEDQNFVRAHALAYASEHGCDMETAALRVFSNAEGAYGSNVNQLIDSGAWNDEDELAETYTRRKCFAYGRDGAPARQSELLGSMLKDVDLAYQNLESVELGVTTIDHYFDTLGGIGRAVRRAKGSDAPVYIGDQTRGEGKIRTLSEQVALETRTRMLNPKWYEGMLDHGYEGVRQIEAHITNTMGWSATTGQVAPWVYQKLTQTFLLDEDMRRRLADLNPKASAKVANRLIEASERDYWSPDEETLNALRQAGDELEDRLEGVGNMVAAQTAV